MKKVLFFILAIIIAACENDKVSFNNEDFQLSTDSLFFRGRGGFRNIAIEGEEWYVRSVTLDGTTFHTTSVEQKIQKSGEKFVKAFDWLTIEVDKGQVFMFTDFNHADETRNFRIEFRSKNNGAILNGAQEGNIYYGENFSDIVSPSSRAFKFDGKGGTCTITKMAGSVAGVIIGGKQYDLSHRWSEPLDAQCEWLRIREEGNTIELIAEENLSAEPRIFWLDIWCGNYSPIYQGIQQARVEIPAGDVIGFTPSKVELPVRGGTVEVEAQTDGWVLDENSMCCDDWLTIEPHGNRLKLTATPNYDYEIRDFTLLFRKGDYYEYLEGEQVTR